MSSNPNNAIGTNAAYGGRTSANAFNDDLAAYTSGIVSGWACEPESGLTVSLGGDGNIRDVAIAEDNAGNKTTINNISGSPVNVTLETAPGANSRIDLIVSYADNPPQGESTEIDNPGACGIISVAGSPSDTPIEPDDNAIRTAITADGASGTTAYYVVLAKVTISAGTTDLIASNITAGSSANIKAKNIDFTTFGGCTEDEVKFSGTKASVGETSITVKEYEITRAGLYFVAISASNASSTTKGRLTTNCFKGNTEICSAGSWSITAWSGNNFCECQANTVIWLEAGDVLTMKVRNQNVTASVDWSLKVKNIF